jgi:hypothetical protein
MRRVFLFTVLYFTVGFAMIHSSAVESFAAEPSGKLLRHIVLYKFKDDLPPAQLQEVIAAFAALPKKIDTIAGFEHGTNVSPEGKSEGFTHVFVVTFRNEKDRDAYLQHPAHLDYVKVVKDRREKVIVLDYWTGN